MFNLNRKRKTIKKSKTNKLKNVSVNKIDDYLVKLRTNLMEYDIPSPRVTPAQFESIENDLIKKVCYIIIRILIKITLKKVKILVNYIKMNQVIYGKQIQKKWQIFMLERMYILIIIVY